MNTYTTRFASLLAVGALLLTVVACDQSSNPVGSTLSESERDGISDLGPFSDDGDNPKTMGLLRDNDDLGISGDAVFGITREDGSVYIIDLANDLSGPEATKLFETGITGGKDNWPNALAFDDGNGRLYYVGDDNTQTLKVVDIASILQDELALPLSESELDAYQDDAGTLSARAAGATFYEGAFWYVPHFSGNDNLHKVTFGADGTIDADNVEHEDFAGSNADAFAFGDLATRSDGTLFFHGETVVSGTPDQIVLSTIDPGTGAYNQLVEDNPESDPSGNGTFAAKYQIAFGPVSDAEPLYAHQTFSNDRDFGDTDGRFFILDTGNGERLETPNPTIDGEDGTPLILTDLAAAGEIPEFGDRAISFLAFCGVDGSSIAADDLVVTREDEDGEPLRVSWNSSEPVEEVVVKAGQNWYLFEGDGTTSGVASVQGDLADDTGTGKSPTLGGTERTPPSPCDGNALKFEWENGEFAQE